MVDDNVSYENVSSSNLLAVGYDKDNSNLFIIFKDKDGRPSSKYVYYHVPSQVHAELMAAESKGKYLAAYIKGTYSYERLAL